MIIMPNTSYVLLGGLGTIDVVVTGARADDDLQLIGGIQDFCGYFVAADDHRIRVDDRRKQIRFVCIAFEKSDVVIRCLENFYKLFNGRG
jgi:hypothetical protein